MEQTQNHGGKRSNSGRKPSGIEKKPLTIYVKKDHVQQVGGMKEMRKLINEKIEQTFASDTAKIIICLAIGILACFADNIFNL